jgi:ABC-type multidrug transport system fused ATPase/permease subunit
MASSAFTESEALMNGYVPYQDLQHYSNSYFHVNTSGFSLTALPDAHEHPLFYVGVYALIGFATATVGVLSTAIQYNGALKASRSIFRKLLTGVVCATMRWHDVTPAGRMLNRFGKVRSKRCSFGLSAHAWWCLGY